MKKALILLTVGTLVLVAALASVVYEKFKIVDEIVNTTIKEAEDSTKKHLTPEEIRMMTKDVLRSIDSLKKEVASADSLSRVQE